MLPTDPAAFDQARQAALETDLTEQKKLLASNKDYSHAWDCFPTVVGASRKGTITDTPSTGPLTKPLSVTCTVESMVPTVMQGWILTLSQSWDAGPAIPRQGVRGRRDGRSRPALGVGLERDQRFVGVPAPGTVQLPGLSADVARPSTAGRRSAALRHPAPVAQTTRFGSVVSRTGADFTAGGAFRVVKGTG